MIHDLPPIPSRSGSGIGKDQKIYNAVQKQIKMWQVDIAVDLQEEEKSFAAMCVQLCILILGYIFFLQYNNAQANLYMWKCRKLHPYNYLTLS